jgi:ectoine hydroxylase-related dioxygenase (phytanoyl-CoA dioxygenase family)
VDPAAADTFRTRGVVVVRQLFDPAWIATLRDVVDRILERSYAPASKTGEETSSRSVASDGMWRWCEPFARLLFTSPIGSTAADVMDSRSLRLFEDLFLYTEAGDVGASWHRDSPHWPVVGSQLCSVWFSLEPVALESGALHFVAGSHHDGDSVRDEGLAPAFDPDRDTREIVAFATDPGDAVVFHPRLLHAAIGCEPDTPRRTFTIRFAGDDIRWRRRRAYYHDWMEHAGLESGDVLDHLWFPVIRGEVGSPVARGATGVETG